MIKIGGKFVSYRQFNIFFNIGGMGAAFLNIYWGFIKIKIRFIKVVILVKLVYFGENDCLSLELKDYKKKICRKNIILKTPL